MNLKPDIQEIMAFFLKLLTKHEIRVNFNLKKLLASSESTPTIKNSEAYLL